MQKAKIKKIIRTYVDTLEANGFPISAVYLFGSQASGKTNKWSDIDVAVVTSKLKKNYEKNRSLLYRMRLKVDNRLEPHGFTEESFNSDANPLAWEIRKTGERVI